MARRAGSIYEKGDRKFLVRVYLGDDTATGRRRNVNKTVHGSKKDAQKVLNALLRERDMGNITGLTRQTVNEYLDEWFEIAKRPAVRPRTYLEYQAQLARYIRPVVGKTYLTELEPMALQRLYGAMLNRGLSARTVELTHRIFNDALDQALRWRKISFNPGCAVELPKQQRREMRALSAEESRRFLYAAKDSRWFPLFSLLIGTGLRPSEAIALLWRDLDPARSLLTVRRKLTFYDRTWAFEAPKTATSKRTVEMPQELTKLLLTLPPDASCQHGLLFTDGAGEPVKLRKVIEHHFKRALEQAGLPDEVRLYDLRHTYATLLLQAGENLKIVSSRLGHATIRLTADTYCHVLPDMQQEGTKKLNAMLFLAQEDTEAKPIN